MDPRIEKPWISNLKFILVAGGGLFADGYLNFTIGLVVPILGYIYFKDQHNALTAVQGDEIKGSFSLGMILGQIAFGTLGDALGRHIVYGKECMFTIFGTLMVVLLPWKGLSHQGIIAWMAVFRATTGVGAGGDYPMSSSLAAEHRVIGTRARSVLLVFSCIPFGSLTCGIVYVILLRAFKSAVERNVNHLEWVWRLLLGLGIVPTIFTLYARLKIKETEPYQKYVATETSLVDDTKRGYRTQIHDFCQFFKEWRHAKVLIATCMCWFLYDIAFYGVGLNQSIILKDIGYASGTTPWEKLYNTSIGNVIVILAGQLPGACIGIFLPDLVGRRNLQLYSSLITAIIYAIWAGVSDTASKGGLITLFTLSQLVINFGPSTTTFLIPVELFPTRVRASAHGLSAASGKCGAVLTAFAFGTITDTLGIRGALGLFAGVMVLVAVFSLWIPEVKGKTLDEIEAGDVWGDSREVQIPPEECVDRAVDKTCKVKVTSESASAFV